MEKRKYNKFISKLHSDVIDICMFPELLAVGWGIVVSATGASLLGVQAETSVTSSSSVSRGGLWRRSRLRPGHSRPALPGSIILSAVRDNSPSTNSLCFLAFSLKICRFYSSILVKIQQEPLVLLDGRQLSLGSTHLRLRRGSQKILLVMASWG